MLPPPTPTLPGALSARALLSRLQRGGYKARQPPSCPVRGLNSSGDEARVAHCCGVRVRVRGTGGSARGAQFVAIAAADGGA